MPLLHEAYVEIMGNNFGKSGFKFRLASALDSKGAKDWIVDEHREYRKRFAMHTKQ